MLPAALTGTWTSSFPGPAPPAAAPIRSSCLRLAGQPASRGRWGLPPANGLPSTVVMAITSLVDDESHISSAASASALGTGRTTRGTPAIDAEVDLGTTGDAYLLQARLNVSLPGVERELAQALVDEAHQTCPYSKATRGNIDVEIKLV